MRGTRTCETTPGSHCPVAQPRLSSSQVKSVRGIERALLLFAAGCMGERGGEKACRGPARGCGGIEREGAMSWTKPAFEEIKMDAEAKSYSDGITW